jgi:glycolate oxidase
MNFSNITLEIKQKLIDVVGANYCLTEKNSIEDYCHDETEDLNFPPEVVVKPANTNEVSEIMKLASKYNIPVTPCGARTGLSGGALCVYGGIALSMERFNKILKIDEDNLQIITQSGVITQELQNAVQEKGLYYAPDPSSRGTCFIGGNIAENAGGPRAVKYGVTKDFVLNLEVVLPNGEVIETGANTLKNSTGYNLTQLMVGSEGTLGIVTQATLKLIPCPKHNMLMLVPFTSAEKACEAIASIFKAGITPSAMEFMERDAIQWTMDFTKESPVKLKENEQAHLLIEVDGNDTEVLFKECEVIASVVEELECGEIMFAETEAQKDALWFLRRRVGEAVKATSIYKEEDTVVPRYNLPKLLKGVKAIGNKYGFKSICYGHAGDGNLHINIIKGDMTDDAWNNELSKGIRELFELTVALGGTLSGEHGIGYVQKHYMDIAFTDVELNLMKGIKNIFDPKRILNPGKIFA